MPTKQGTDELVLIRKVGDRKDANKVMLVTELERETEKIEIQKLHLMAQLTLVGH